MNLIRRAKSQVRRIASRRRSNGEAAVAGEDILDVLKREHEEVAALLNRLVETDSGPARKRLVQQIKTALVPHLRAEEKVLYRAVIRLRDRRVRQHGEEGIIEHRLADNILAGLGRARSATSPQFEATAKVLRELMQHHVDEEEREIWQDVRENFSADERMRMTRRFETEKQRVRAV